MKTVTFYPSKKRAGINNNILHIETELGIINITVGLTDRLERKVEAITVRPDRYMGEQEVIYSGHRFIQLKKIIREGKL